LDKSNRPINIEDETARVWWYWAISSTEDESCSMYRKKRKAGTNDRDNPSKFGQQINMMYYADN